MTTTLFFYGTLKRGLCRSHALDGQRFLGEARTQPKYRMFNLGSYPGMVEAAEGVSIDGELWEVDAECLRRLDVIEGVAFGQYERRTVRLLAPHDTTTAQTYIYLRSTAGCPDCGTRW